MKDVYASIVCYNPDISKLQRNVESIYRQVDCVLIIDNGSQNASLFQQSLKDYPGIIYIRHPQNMGIAYALNKALDYCRGKCQWLITLDQDSCAAPDMVEILMQFRESDKVAIISPRIVDINFKSKCELEYSSSHLVISAITSGCLNKVDALEKCGGFKEELFIDYVDHEICLRLNSYGYNILQATNAILYQEVGKITTHNIMGINIATTNHLPFRRYFLFRNKIYVQKMFFIKYPIWCIEDLWESVKTIIRVVLFEQNKKKNLRCIIRGIIDGLRSNFDNSWPFTIV